MHAGSFGLEQTEIVQVCGRPPVVPNCKTPFWQGDSVRKTTCHDPVFVLRQRTTWWSWAFNLTLLSAVCTVMMYRLNQREKANLPLPRLDVLW